MEFHQALLADSVGQHAFRQALLRVVRPGDCVLDLGTGLGLHAMFACQAGARHIYAVDRDDIIEAAKQVCHDNGFAGRITFFETSAAELELPEKVDVIVTNQSLFDMPRLLMHARSRFLKPGGILVPSALDLWCAPVMSQAPFQGTAFWNEQHFGFSFAAAHRFSVNKAVASRFAADELLGEAIHLAHLDFNRCDGNSISRQTLLPLARAGRLHGVALWYDVKLADGISVSTDPRCDLPIKVWPSFFLPMTQEVPVEPGDTLEFALSMQFEGRATLSWIMTVRDSRGSQKLLSRHSDAFARPISLRRLHKRTQDYRPVRNAAGEKARVALENFDGQHESSWIRQELQRRFPHPTLGDLAEEDFLSKLLDEFSE